MKFTPQSIKDVVLIEPLVIEDSRGYFLETFQKKQFEDEIEHKTIFVQENESKSKKGVLRGLHYQIPPFAQAKLVRVVDGCVLDVAVDIRKSSPTFGKYVSKILSSSNKHQLYIPHGFAHGFVVLSTSAIFSYKVDNYYSKKHSRAIAYNDHELKIDWSIDDNDFQLSENDKKNPCLRNAIDLFE